MNLRPWRRSGILNETRTVGEVGFRRNGTSLDIWIRIDGKPCWFGVHRDLLCLFLDGNDSEVTLFAESDGNHEPDMMDAVER